MLSFYYSNGNPKFEGPWILTTEIKKMLLYSLQNGSNRLPQGLAQGLRIKKFCNAHSTDAKGIYWFTESWSFDDSLGSLFKNRHQQADYNVNVGD